MQTRACPSSSVELRSAKDPRTGAKRAKQDPQASRHMYKTQAGVKAGCYTQGSVSTGCNIQTGVSTGCNTQTGVNTGCHAQAGVDMAARHTSVRSFRGSLE